MSIEKIVCTWAYGTGSPGYTVFYWTANAGLTQTAVTNFWQGIKAYLPPAVVVTTPNTGAIIDEATGKQTGVWTAGSTVAATGTQAGSYDAAAGMLIRWDTNQFLNGRRVRGRTFLVPFGQANLGQGTWSSASANAVNVAATSLIGNGSNNLIVWHRPVYDHSVTPPVLKTPGARFAISTSTAPTKPCVMRSRRD